MPRTARLDAPGVLHHVMFRGIERGKIFRNNKDREDFIERYESFVKEGLTQGRRKELTGGGLIRSLGGWTEARESLKGRDHVMSDERILGDSDFVDSVISQSEEQYERRYELK